MTMSSLVSIKLVIVGDQAVGKTSMLYSYSYKQFPSCCILRPCYEYHANLNIEGHEVNLELWDTAAGEQYDRLRPLAYPQTDVFVVCFSAISPESLKNAREKWIPEVRHHCPDTPILLAGTKVDLRDNKDPKLELAMARKESVNKEEGIKLAHKAKVHGYMECSALTQEGLDKVFEEAVRAVIHAKKKRRSSHTCVLF